MLGDAMLTAPLHYAADEYSLHKKVFVFMGDMSSELDGLVGLNAPFHSSNICYNKVVYLYANYY